MDEWDVIVRSSIGDYGNVYNLHLRVSIPCEQIASLVSRGKSAQHEIVDYVSRRLHEFIEREFSQLRLPDHRRNSTDEQPAGSSRNT